MLNFKKFTVASAIVSCLCFSSTASAGDINVALQNICLLVKNDDRGQFRKKIKSVHSNYSVKLRDYYDGITCAGKSLLKSSFENNSIEVGEMIIKQLPKKTLRKAEHDDKGAVLEWATTTGQNEALLAVLKDRIG